MSVFSTWFQGEMDANGWDQRAAAKAVGVRETTVHNWLHQDARPNGTNIFRVARAVKKPVEVVARAADYDDGTTFATEEEAAAARTALLANLPQFQAILETVAKKPLEDQPLIIKMIRRVLLDRPEDTDPAPK